MKFSSVLLFASVAFASPLALQPRQQTVVGTISDAVKTLETATDKNAAEIKKAVMTAKNSVEANVEAQVKSTLQANYKAILKAFEDATKSITKVTTEAAGGVAGAAKGLSKQEVENLTETLKRAKKVISNIEATIEVTATDLKPSIRQAIKSEVDAVKGAIAPFFKPLTEFAAAAMKAAVTAGFAVKGLEDVLAEINTVLKNLSKSIGVPGLGDLLNGALGKISM